MSARDWRGLRRVLRLPLGKRAVRGDVDAELRFHVQGRVDELVAAGMSRPAAEAEVARAFGDYARIEAEVERIDMAMHRRRSLLERAATLRGDVRHACRTLLRQPTFSLVVVLTLAVGIGATAAIFHVVDRMVLRPLPYPHADRIVYLGWSWAGKGDYTGSLSPQKFEFFHAESHVFDALTAEHGISPAAAGKLVMQPVRWYRGFASHASSFVSLARRPQWAASSQAMNVHRVHPTLPSSVTPYGCHASAAIHVSSARW
jgi:hypothetical protein